MQNNANTQIIIKSKQNNNHENLKNLLYFIDLCSNLFSRL